MSYRIKLADGERLGRRKWKVSELSDETIREILTKYRTVAVVGLSDNPSRPSYGVAEYLKNHGFRIIPVNPFTKTVLGEISYPSLLGIPEDTQKTIEVVDIFRKAEDVPPIVEEAVQLRKLHRSPHVVWMQLGIVNEQAAETARKAGFTVIMNHCMMQEHRRLFETK